MLYHSAKLRRSKKSPSFLVEDKCPLFHIVNHNGCRRLDDAKSQGIIRFILPEYTGFYTRGVICIERTITTQYCEMCARIYVCEIVPWAREHLSFLMLIRLLGNPRSGTLGPVSYRTISWSLETARLVVLIIISLWNLTATSAALLPRCLSNFKAIVQF